MLFVVHVFFVVRRCMDVFGSFVSDVVDVFSTSCTLKQYLIHNFNASILYLGVASILYLVA